MLFPFKRFKRANFKYSTQILKIIPWFLAFKNKMKNDMNRSVYFELNITYFYHKRPKMFAKEGFTKLLLRV